MRALSIGQLAKAAKVSVDTIRFYEKSGLLPAAARRLSGLREYSNVDVRQLRFILRAKRLGFSLDDIRGILDLNADADPEHVKSIIQQQLQSVEKTIAELQHWRKALLTIPVRGARLSRVAILESFEPAVAVLKDEHQNAPGDAP